MRPTAEEVKERELPVTRALFLTAVFGIPMIGLLSFAVWFSPWYAVPWP